MPKTDHVREAATNIARIAMRVNPVEIATPSNMLHQKQNWISTAESGFFGNPIFEYDKDSLRRISNLGPQLEQVARDLFNNIFPDNQLDKAVYDIIMDRIADARTSIAFATAIIAGDDAGAADSTKRKYGRPSNEQLDTAYRMARRQYSLGNYKSCFDEGTITQLKAKSFDAEGIRGQFQAVLDYYGISGWEIIIDPGASSIDVRDKTSNNKPRVVIPVDRKVNGLKLIELIGHELECHLRDSENSRELFRELLGENSPLAPLIPLLAKSDDEMLYEGHAKQSDARITGNSALPKPYYTIAQDMATNGESFATVANHICKLYLNVGSSNSAAVKGAWLATYRAFRGISDPTNPHAYTFGKDYAYLAGFIAASELEHPDLLDFASMTLFDLERLQKASVGLKPKYPLKGATTYVASLLL